MASLYSKSESFGESNKKRILSDWIKATTNFGAQYRGAVTVIDQQDSKPTEAYLGQCPVESLLTVVVTMKSELERLVRDMDQSALFYPPTSRQHYEKMSEHTGILNQLTEKVQVRIQLMASSSS